MAKNTKKTPTPEQDKTKEPKANPNNLEYNKGNGEFIIAQLLTLVCNKLDEMRNHTSTLVIQNDKIIKLLEDNQI